MHTIMRAVKFGYYAKEALKNGYYEAGSIMSAWIGRASGVWGLTGEVLERAYANLMRGFSPDGKTALVQNAGRKRFEAEDHTLSANKYVSVLWALERTAAGRRAIERVVFEAAKFTFQVMEESALFSRRGAQGRYVEQAKGGMFMGLFLHGSSRRNEPALHAHGILFNSVLRPSDNSYGTILGVTAGKDAKKRRASRSAPYAVKVELDRVFQESVRAGIAALGFRTTDADARHGYFTVDGVPRALVDKFSTRAKEIAADLKARGKSGAKESRASALLTRPAKRIVPLDTLRAGWIEQAEGWNPASIRGQAAAHEPKLVISDDLRAQIQAKAWEQATGARARRLAIEREAAKGGAANSQAVHAATAKAASHARDDDQASQRSGRGEGTTHKRSDGQSRSDERRAREKDADDRHARAQNARWKQGTHRADSDAATSDDDVALGNAGRIARILRRARRDGSHVLTRANVYVAARHVELVERARLTDAQRAGLVAITRKRGSVQFLRTQEADGRPEPVLRAARLAWSRHGLRTLIVTPRSDDAKELEAKTGVHAMSVRGLMRGLVTNRGLVRGYDAMMRRSMQLGMGFRTSKGALNYLLAASGRYVSLDSKCVVVIAHPELVSSTERLWLMRRAQRAGAKLVFMGRSCSPETGPSVLMGTRRRAFDHERERSL
jgi:conjugative relaxase-like TrwC/TraI family protein